MTKNCQSRNYCFTAWNEDFSHINIKAFYNEYDDIIRGLLVGDEIAPTTGKRHWQGFIQFKNKKTKGGAFTILKHAFKINFSQGLFACKGTEKDNDIYCSKSNKTIKLGTFKTQGGRTDLEEIYRLIKNGSSMLYIAENFASQWTQYRRSFEKYKELCQQRSSRSIRKLHVELISGPTNTYKTSSVFTASDPEDTFLIDGSDLQWWDGYNGEKTLIIDEYNNDVKITQLLKLLDKFPKRLSIKGGFTYANWTEVYITTNLAQLHENAKYDHIKALERRIDIHFETFRTEEGVVHWQNKDSGICIEIAKVG